MDVSIIIVNYNTLKVTAQCLDSIFRLTCGLSFEVILVDNASTDGSKEIFSQDKRIKYIYSDRNLGFGKANNLGFQTAAGEYIFLLNSDTILLNNAVLHLYAAIRNLPHHVACIGAQLLSADLKPIHSFGCFPTLPNTCATIGRVYKNILGFKPVDSAIGISQKPFEVPYITGADLFIKRSVVDRLGLFDPDFISKRRRCNTVITALVMQCILCRSRKSFILNRLLRKRQNAVTSRVNTSFSTVFLRI